MPCHFSIQGKEVIFIFPSLPCNILHYSSSGLTLLKDKWRLFSSKVSERNDPGHFLPNAGKLYLPDNYVI